jgi:hypothetical protein
MGLLISRIEELQKELEKFISYKGAKLTYNINNKPPVSFDDFYKNLKRFITSIERLNNSELSSKVSKLDLDIADERLLYELESELVCIFDILEDVLYKRNKQSAIKVNSKNINSSDLKSFFKEMNNQLEKIKEEFDEINRQINEDNWDYYDTCHPDIFDACTEAYKLWKKQLLIHLDRSYKIRVKTITSPLDNEYLVLKTVLRDMYWKYNKEKSKSEENFSIEKFLKAREGNIEFELELAKMITGENTYFPYRSEDNIKRFFQNLGEEISLIQSLNILSEEDKLKNLSLSVEKKLKRLAIPIIYNLITVGLFKKKYFKEYVDKINSEINEERGEYSVDGYYYEDDYDLDSFFKRAEKEFKEFIQNSMIDDNPFNLSNVLDMNVNIELLFDNKATTKDEELNKLIEEAKERFLSNDKPTGLEKLWDAYERLKTHFSNITINSTEKQKKKEKGKSAKKIVDIITENFDKDFIDNEFKALTTIGNSYRIRHSERGQRELTSQHINYFFFRMMSLIDLCLVYLNEEEL